MTTTSLTPAAACSGPLSAWSDPATNEPTLLRCSSKRFHRPHRMRQSLLCTPSSSGSNRKGHAFLSIPCQRHSQLACGFTCHHLSYLSHSWTCTDTVTLGDRVFDHACTRTLGAFNSLFCTPCVLKTARLLAIISSTTTIMHLLKIARLPLASMTSFVPHHRVSIFEWLTASSVYIACISVVKSFPSHHHLPQRIPSIPQSGPFPPPAAAAAQAPNNANPPTSLARLICEFSNRQHPGLTYAHSPQRWVYWRVKTDIS